MDKVEIISNVLKNAVWGILLIIDIVLLINVVKQKKDYRHKL